MSESSEVTANVQMITGQILQTLISQRLSYLQNTQAQGTDI